MATDYENVFAAVKQFEGQNVTAIADSASLWGQAAGPVAVYVFDFTQSGHAASWYSLVHERFADAAGFIDPASQSWCNTRLVPFAAVGGSGLEAGNTAYLFFALDRSDGPECPVLIWRKDSSPLDGFEVVANSVADLRFHLVGEPAPPVSTSTALVQGASSGAAQVSDEAEMLAYLSYASIVVGIPFFVIPMIQRKDAYALHHAKHAGAAFLVGLVLAIVVTVLVVITCGIATPLYMICMAPLIPVLQGLAGALNKEMPSTLMDPVVDVLFGSIQVEDH